MKLNERQACQILGLAAPTTLEKARKAYRKLAQRFHPDKGGDEERFKQVAEAYQYLVEYYGDSKPEPKAKRTHSTKTKRKAAPRKKKTASQTKPKKKASQTDDHREAWKTWRENVDRHHEAQRKRKEEQQKHANSDRYEQSARQPTNKQSTKTQTTTDQGNHSSDIVEASIVPTLGDKLKRWGEEVGDKITEATGEIGQRLGKWYRKGSRGLFEKGSDEKLKLNIDLETVLHGKQVRIAVYRQVACPQCQYVDGEQRKDQAQPASQWAQGCQNCNESGRVSEREELNIYVPPGGDQGDKLKVNDKGSDGLNGAPNGHLYLMLHPAPLPKGFKRHGANVELQQPVSTELLRTGGVLPIKTLRGSLNIKVPPSLNSGKKLKVPKQGFPVWSNPEQVGELVICLRALV